jgi:hypothetical protein
MKHSDVQSDRNWARPRDLAGAHRGRHGLRNCRLIFFSAVCPPWRPVLFFSAELSPHISTHGHNWARPRDLAGAHRGRRHGMRRVLLGSRCQYKIWRKWAPSKRKWGDRWVILLTNLAQCVWKAV